jgi:hypothetical protein
MDEVSWKLINMNLKMRAERGTDGVSWWFPGNPKTCVTAIATIGAARAKKPLWIIPGGMTERCERQFCSSHQRKIGACKHFREREDRVAATDG